MGCERGVQGSISVYTRWVAREMRNEGGSNRYGEYEFEPQDAIGLHVQLQRHTNGGGVPIR